MYTVNWPGGSINTTAELHKTTLSNKNNCSVNATTINDWTDSKLWSCVGGTRHESSSMIQSVLLSRTWDLRMRTRTRSQASRTRTWKLVLENPRGQGLSSRTTTLDSTAEQPSVCTENTAYMVENVWHEPTFDSFHPLCQWLKAIRNYNCHYWQKVSMMKRIKLCSMYTWRRQLVMYGNVLSITIHWVTNAHCVRGRRLSALQRDIIHACSQIWATTSDNICG